MTWANSHPSKLHSKKMAGSKFLPNKWNRMILLQCQLTHTFCNLEPLPNNMWYLTKNQLPLPCIAARWPFFSYQYHPLTHFKPLTNNHTSFLFALPRAWRYPQIAAFEYRASSGFFWCVRTAFRSIRTAAEPMMPERVECTLSWGLEDGECVAWLGQ